MKSRQHLADDAAATRASRLSAAVDGEASAAETQALIAAWRAEAEVRADWQLYHLIGDTLRSDDFARPPSDSARFLASFRERLAQEPVVLAPAPLAAPVMAPAPPVRWRAAARWRRWSAPAAVAAGMLSVAGVAVMLRGQSLPDTAPAPLAQTLPAPQTSARQASVATLARQDTQVAGPASALVRDPVLDRYLEAHRQQGRGASLAAPDGIRQVVNQPIDQ